MSVSLNSSTCPPRVPDLLTQAIHYGPISRDWRGGVENGRVTRGPGIARFGPPARWKLQRSGRRQTTFVTSLNATEAPPDCSRTEELPDQAHPRPWVALPHAGCAYCPPTCGTAGLSASVETERDQITVILIRKLSRPDALLSDNHPPFALRNPDLNVKAGKLGDLGAKTIAKFGVRIDELYDHAIRGSARS